MKRAALSRAVLSVLSLAGCIADDPDAAPAPTVEPTAPDASPTVASPLPGGFGRSRLNFFSDCPDLVSYLQTEATARVTAWGLGGGPSWYGRGMLDDATAGNEVAMAATDEASAPIPGYSGTNIQEAGVDEGDAVETNGTHVFVAGQDAVRIVDVVDATVIVELDVPGGTHQLVLEGTRLLVVTQPWTGVEDTIVSLFDVTDASRPSLVRRTHLEGRMVATRSIDGIARLVLTSSMATRLPFVFPEQFGLDEERALAENQRIIRESTIDEWLPRWFDEDADGSFGAMAASLDCRAVAAPRDFAGLGVSWIASVDTSGDRSPVGAAGVVSTGETVYASSSNLYLATVPRDWSDAADGQSEGRQPATVIHQFSLDDSTGATYVASGDVPGILLNQFSMSEFQGDLRVATTQQDWTGGGASESAVSVLRPDGDELVTVGWVGGLGRTEQIYGVRFVESQAYVVTFRQTDPLYVIDLSDPVAPVLSGELKIPGYSAYLHPVGDGLLLGVGQDADLEGRTLGTKLSLFDVGDPSDPRQISSMLIGGSSEAEWDHKAFLFWPEDGTIVIPVGVSWQECGSANGCLADQVTSAAGGAVVARLEGTQLIAAGTIEHESSQTNCWNPLQRSMIIGSEIVTIGLDQLQFTDRTTLVARDHVRWGRADEGGCASWVEG